MPIVKFKKENKEIEVPAGAWLRKEAAQAGINANQGVNGIGASLNRFLRCPSWGLCGTCRVLITKGMENTNPLTLREKLHFKFPSHNPFATLGFVGNEDQMRLACMTQVNGDIEVETGPEVNLFGENFFS